MITNGQDSISDSADTEPKPIMDSGFAPYAAPRNDSGSET